MNIINPLINSKVFLQGPLNIDFKELYPLYNYSEERLSLYQTNKSQTILIMLKAFLIGTISSSLLNTMVSKKNRIRSALKLLPVSFLVGTCYGTYHAEEKIWDDY